jgi:2-amino-4-hydroxy-6-hydroxymethyldihydropteridine diphosphokinase
MPRAFIGIGSNIDPEKNVKEALRLLSARTSVLKISTVYHTEPELRPEQPWYYNCVAEIDTELRPEELKFALLRGIEKELGRKRTADKFAERTIDLDLLLYSDPSVEPAGLFVQDPDIFRRPYLAAALLELSPGLKLREPQSLEARVPEPALSTARPEVPPSKMEVLEAYTQSLRKEILRGGKC